MLLGCKKNNIELIDGKTPEARVNETLAYYKSTLVDYDKGWIACVYPAGTSNYPRGGYTFYMKFTPDGKVDMYSDFNNNTIVAKKQSAYSVQITGRPSLNFDTYNYIHLLADPSTDVNGGEAGRGYYSDFEFGFKKIYADSVVFEGNLYKSKMVLRKATAQDLTALEQHSYVNLKNDIQNYALLYPFLYVNPVQGTNNTTVLFNMATRMLTFNWKENGVMQEKSIAFAAVLDRLVLKNLFINGDISIAEIRLDKSKNQLFLVDKAGKELAIRPENNPLESFGERISIYRFTALRLQKDNQAGSGSTLYNNTETSMNNGGRKLQYIEITRRAIDTVIVNYRYINSSGSGYNAYKEYILKVNNNGQVTFTDFVSKQTGGNYNNYNNSGAVGTYVSEFHNFLTQNAFDADYETGNINGGVQTLGRLKVSTNNNYFLRWNVN